MILSVKSREKTELIDITAEIQQMIRSAGIDDGLCMLYVPHTTAAVTINESADPSVKADILMILNQIIPWEAAYQHLEGNSAAHIKSTLVGASELVAIVPTSSKYPRVPGLASDLPTPRAVHLATPSPSLTISIPQTTCTTGLPTYLAGEISSTDM